MIEPTEFIRENLKDLQPYPTRDLEGVADPVFLDANENALGDGVVNRYPDPVHNELCERVGQREGVSSDSIVFGNGSDELIDLIVRIFCEPKADAVVISSPTFGVYKISSQLNNVECLDVPLTKSYQLNVDGILEVNYKANVLFICNPNSPTGNRLEHGDVVELLEKWDGIVVVDEAYIEFSTQVSFVDMVGRFPNLIVLRTFSKFWGMAGARLGYAIADSVVIEFMRRAKPLYNVNNLSVVAVNKALDNEAQYIKNGQLVVKERSRLKDYFESKPFVQSVNQSDTNFLFVEFSCLVSDVFNHLKSGQIFVRDYQNYPNHLRITIGSESENNLLIDVLDNFDPLPNSGPLLAGDSESKNLNEEGE